MLSYAISLFLFRRDLRLEDNTGLLHALEESGSVLPIFILDPKQVEGNRYRSDNAVQFMLRSVDELDRELRGRGSGLSIFYGKPEAIIDSLLDQADALYLNLDYTPFSKRRDSSLGKIAKKHGAGFHGFDDALLDSPDSILKKDKGPYQLFTPYFRKASEIGIKRPRKNRKKNFSKKVLGENKIKAFNKALKRLNPDIALRGGRKEALGMLRGLKRLGGCKHMREQPAAECTSMLSAHLKFGTVSAREAYRQAITSLGKDHPMVRELYWRDFFTYIAYHFPKVFNGAFNQKFRGIRWKRDRKSFDAWCRGKTGVPIVDAGMRQLNATGFMHNRARMVCASFLIKDLHLDWRLGEMYFATRLVDYDPAVNNGNWQWVAGVGADSMPHFRSFNPWVQQKRYDPKCRYIKKWVRELRNLEAKEIHALEKKSIDGYPEPIADHAKERLRTLVYYKGKS